MRPDSAVPAPRPASSPGMLVGAFARATPWLVAALALSTVWLAHQVAGRYFEFWPHLEDEVTYWWQAQAAAQGALTVPSPPEPALFLVPFVVDRDGQRFGKYPPGWPVVLGLGMRLGLAHWVNPALAGLAVVLLYALGRRLADPTVGLLAAILVLTSPFFWLQAGSLLSHMWAWALAMLFSLALFDMLTFDGSVLRAGRWLYASTAGLSLSLLLLTRPWTALGVALPWALPAAWAWWKRPTVRGPLILAVSLSLAGVGLVLVWQAALTGNPWQSPYTLWWPYDKPGFGPGHGPLPQGHSLHQAWVNTRFSLGVAAGDVLGWFRFSWLALPLGVWAARRRACTWPVLLTFPGLVLVYMAYWVGAWIMGPRYYFEGLHSWLLATAWGLVAGWRALAGWPWGKALRVGAAAGVVLLIALNLRFYLPQRLGMMYGLYDMTPRRVAVFLTPQAQVLTPAWVRVQGVRRWNDYAVYLPLQDPWLRTPWVFVIEPATPEQRDHLRQALVGRTEIRYDPRQPFVLAVVQSAYPLP